MSMLLLMTYLQLTDARRSLTKVGFCVADRRGGNSDQAQQIPQLTHSGAKYRDHSTRRSAHHSSPRRYVRAGSSSTAPPGFRLASSSSNTRGNSWLGT